MTNSFIQIPKPVFITSTNGLIPVELTVSGNAVGNSNPIPIAIENVVIEAGELNVLLSAYSNPYDSVRVSDGTNELKINSDGSINVDGGGGGSNSAAGLTGDAVPLYAGYTGFDVGGNLVGVSAGNPLPVTGAFSASLALPTPLTVTSTPVAQSGIWNMTITGQPIATTASLSLPTPLTVTATPVAQSGIWNVNVTDFPSVQSVWVNNPAVTQSGNWSVTTLNPSTNYALETGGNLAEARADLDYLVASGMKAAPTTPVTGTFWQTTQPVSIAGSVPISTTNPLTVENITPVSQSGIWSVGITGTPAVTVSNFPATQPVSINQALAVSQSGNWSVSVSNPASNYSLETGGNLAEARNDLDYLVHSGLAVTNFPALQVVSGVVGIGQNAGDSVYQGVVTGTTPFTIPIKNGQGTVGFSSSGVWTGFIATECSYDGIQNIGTTFVNTFSGAISPFFSTNAAGNGQMNCAGMATISFVPDALVTGTAYITARVSTATATIMADNPIPVTGSFWQATQPVSILQPLSVTATPVAQSGIWTVAVSGSVATTGTTTVNFPDPLTVTATPVAQSGIWNVNITNASLPVTASLALPTPLPVTATPVAQSGIWLVNVVSDSVMQSELLSPQGENLDSNSGVFTFGSVSTNPPSYGPGTINGISLTPGGAQRVDIGSFGGNIVQAIPAQVVNIPPVQQSGTWTVNIGGQPIATTASLSIPQPLPVTATPVAQSGIWNVYVVPSGQTTTFKGRSSSYLIPSRASGNTQRLMSIWNSAGSNVTAQVDKIMVNQAVTVVKAVTTLPPVLRLYPISAAPTNGTALKKMAIGSHGPSSSNISIFGDSQYDGQGSASALTATTVSGTAIAQVTAPRLITAVGAESNQPQLLLGAEDDDVATIGPASGLCVALDYNLTTQNPTTDNYLVTICWTEY